MNHFPEGLCGMPFKTVETLCYEWNINNPNRKKTSFIWQINLLFLFFSLFFRWTLDFSVVYACSDTLLQDSHIDLDVNSTSSHRNTTLPFLDISEYIYYSCQTFCQNYKLTPQVKSCTVLPCWLLLDSKVTRTSCSKNRITASTFPFCVCITWIFPFSLCFSLRYIWCCRPVLRL